MILEEVGFWVWRFFGEVEDGVFCGVVVFRWVEVVGFRDVLEEGGGVVVGLGFVRGCGGGWWVGLCGG